jgi:hypothetical protein
VIPLEANAGFVAAMEDVLEVYTRPRDPDRPLVCLDETSKDAVIQSNLRETTTRVLASVTPREERVLRMRYGSNS